MVVRWQRVGLVASVRRRCQQAPVYLPFAEVKIPPPPIGSLPPHFWLVVTSLYWIYFPLQPGPLVYATPSTFLCTPTQRPIPSTCHGLSTSRARWSSGPSIPLAIILLLALSKTRTIRSTLPLLSNPTPVYSQLGLVFDAHELQVFKLYKIEPGYRTASALSPGPCGERIATLCLRTSWGGLTTGRAIVR